MKICHVINNLKGGGAQNLVVSLAIAQKEMSEVSFIVIEKESIEYEKLLALKLRDHGIKIFFLSRRVGDKLSVIRSIISGIILVRKIQPNVINSHLALSHLFAAIFKFFLFGANSYHAATIQNAPEKWSFLTRMINKKSALIYCSKAAKELNSFTNKNTIVIDNGVNPEVKFQSKENIRDQLLLSCKDKLIISVGSLRPQKNYRFLVSLAKKINNKHIHFIVCGGSYEKGYEKISIFENVPNIHYLGLRFDIQNLIMQSDCFLSCSLFEGLPVAVLEAYFTGIPCVLSPIVQHQNIAMGIEACYIPKKFEVDDFILIIEKVVSTPANKTEILEKRKEKIQCYSIEYTARRYLDFYKSLKS